MHLSLSALGHWENWELWTYLDRCRFHLSRTGASTLISRKKGRLMKASSTASLEMSVMSHLSRQRLVTKSSRPLSSEKGTSWNELRLIDRFFPSLAPDALEPLSSKHSALKPWSSIRYLATVRLPAHIPVRLRQ